MTFHVFHDLYKPCIDIHSKLLKAWLVLDKKHITLEIDTNNSNYYYMANPVLGKSLCSDWFFLGQDFAVRPVSMETVQSAYFCFGAKPAKTKCE